MEGPDLRPRGRLVSGMAPMIELAIYLVTLVAVGVLVAPVVRRLPAPAWYLRARDRGRPGIPVVAALGSLLLLGLLWLLGEQRGVIGTGALVLWIGAPLTAFFVIRTWIRDRRKRLGHPSP